MLYHDKQALPLLMEKKMVEYDMAKDIDDLIDCTSKGVKTNRKRERKLGGEFGENDRTWPK